MNKIVVVGIVSIIIVAIIAAIIMLNHPSPNSYSNVSSIVTPTTTTTPIITNNTTPPLTTVTPTTSTSNTTTTTTNTSLNLPMNSFYFLGENNTGYYYIFVLNLTSYEKSLQQPHNAKTTIINVFVAGTNIYITPTQFIEKNNYLFVIGYISYNSNSSTSFNPGDVYPIIFVLNNGNDYINQLTYEGNWTGSIP